MLAIRKNFVFAILIVILLALLYGCVQDRSYLNISMVPAQNSTSIWAGLDYMFACIWAL